jgi:hypothetical protein
LKSFHEIEREQIHLNSFYKNNITLLSKLGKNTTKIQKFRAISLRNINTKISKQLIET